MKVVFQHGLHCGDIVMCALSSPFVIDLTISSTVTISSVL